MSNITLTIPNDDHIALRAFGKALEEMALAHGAEPGVDPRFKCDKEFPAFEIPSVRTVDGSYPLSPSDLPEVDTTAQQVESLGNQQFSAAGSIVSVASSPHDVDPDTIPTEQFTEVTGFAPTTDSTGTPWDERIHSASKALNADGTWRLRRKPKDMDEAEWAAFVESVKGELHTQTPVMTDEEVKTLEHVEIGEPTREEVEELIKASNKMLEPPVTPPGDDFHTDGQTIAGIPPIPVPPPVVVAPPVPEVTTWDFPRLMTFLTERHGKIDVATVNTLLAQDGLASLQELNAHPDKIGPFVARVKAHLGE